MKREEEGYRYSPDEVIVRLKKLIKTIEKMQADMDSEITHAQVRVIFPIIKDNQGYTIQELADLGGVSKGLVSRTISDLEGKGYVERDKIKENQDRNIKIILSAKGQELVTKKKAHMQEVSNKWKDRLTHNDLESFMKVLNVITEIQE